MKFLSRRNFFKTTVGLTAAGVLALEVSTGKADASEADTSESGWKWCNRCQGIWNKRVGDLEGRTGRCKPASFSGGHTSDGSGEYFLATALSHTTGTTPAPFTNMVFQPQWRTCIKCLLLFWDGWGAGVCPAGGGHEAFVQNNYRLLGNTHPTEINPDIPNHQQRWTFCNLCHTMFFFKPNLSTVCPVNQNGGWHYGVGSWNFFLPLGAPPSYGQ